MPSGQKKVPWKDPKRAKVVKIRGQAMEAFLEVDDE